MENRKDISSRGFPVDHVGVEPFFIRPRHGKDNQCRESREERGSKIEVMSPWRLLMDDTTGRAFEMKRRVYEGTI